jgi:ubiquitin C-terminal hydrolase
MTETKGVIGLTNIGNTCYGNAVLQALRHESDLTVFFLLNKHVDILKRKQARADKDDERAKQLIERYAELIRNMWSSEKGVEKTNDFWRDMVKLARKKGFEQFQFPVAHDAHEFIVFMLDQLHEGLSEEVEMTLLIDESKKEVKSALEFWKSSFEKSYSPIVELLFSLKRKNTVCDVCKYSSVTWETFNTIDITLPDIKEDPQVKLIKIQVPGQVAAEAASASAEPAPAPPVQADGPLKLIDLLLADGKGDSLDDYVCGGSCSHTENKRTKASVSRSVWRLGSWVILNLKRFTNRGQRINTPVDIPLQMSFDSIFYDKSIEPSRSHMYELFATVHHHGPAGGGHYTARAKHPVTGQWNIYDDENTHPIAAPMPLDPSVYIIMYRRIKPQPAS